MPSSEALPPGSILISGAPRPTVKVALRNELAIRYVVPLIHERNLVSAGSYPNPFLCEVRRRSVETCTRGKLSPPVIPMVHRFIAGLSRTRQMRTHLFPGVGVVTSSYVLLLSSSAGLIIRLVLTFYEVSRLCVVLLCMNMVLHV